MVHHHDDFCIYDGRTLRYYNRGFALRVVKDGRFLKDAIETQPLYYCPYCGHDHKWKGHQWLCALEGCHWTKPRRPMSKTGTALKILDITVRMFGPPKG